MALISAVTLAAQQSPGNSLDLEDLTGQVESAMTKGDWKRAAELSANLRDAVQNRRDQSFAAENAKLVDEVLGWLPDDTETLIVAQQPFVLTAGEGRQREVANALDTARSYVTMLLDVIEDGNLGKILTGKIIRTGILAARKFEDHPPGEGGVGSLGLIAYEGCALYAFAQQSLEPFLPEQPQDKILGHPVWVSQGTQHEQAVGAKAPLDTYLTVQPRPGLIVVCNNRSFLTEILDRMPSPQHATRALPETLPEWRQVDRSAPLWAIRHFGQDRADVDPTYPANSMPGTKGAESITGVIAQFSAAGTTARMLSASQGEDPWKDLTDSPDFHGAAHSRRVSGGVWELSVDNNRPEASYFAVFALMATLGFAVYL
jgi:hypothetical protein